MRKTAFFLIKWNKSTKDSALFYRLKPYKIETKTAVGYHVKGIDSVFVIRDFYLPSHKKKYTAVSIDSESTSIIGPQFWYND